MHVFCANLCIIAKKVELCKQEKEICYKLSARDTKKLLFLKKNKKNIDTDNF